MRKSSKTKISMVSRGGSLALLAMAVLAGCGAGGDIKGFSVNCENQYQYQPVEVEDISVKKGSKDVALSDLGVAYVFSTPAYSGETFSMYIDGNLYETTLSNYVKAESISWAYNGASYVPDTITDGELQNPEIVTGSFTYTDGTTWDCTAEYVTVTRNGESYDFCIVSGDTTYYASFPAQLGVKPATQPSGGVTTAPESEGNADEGTSEGTEADVTDESSEGSEASATDKSSEGTPSSNETENESSESGEATEDSESSEESSEESKPGEDDAKDSEATKKSSRG